MSWKDKITELDEKLERLIKVIEQKNEVIKILRHRVMVLEERENSLLDRLMARDIPEYKTYTAFENAPSTPPNPLEDEDLAGESFNPNSMGSNVETMKGVF